MSHEKVYGPYRDSLGARAWRPQDLANTDSFPTQESIHRFRGFIVDSAVLEHAGAPRTVLFSKLLQI
jgi:hypothetical protein